MLLRPQLWQVWFSPRRSSPARWPVPSRSTRRAAPICQIERKKLLTRDMQAALEHGPDWVKDHLNDEEIDRVRHFLSVEEQIKFRCRGGGVAKARKIHRPAPGSRTAPENAEPCRFLTANPRCRGRQRRRQA